MLSLWNVLLQGLVFMFGLFLLWLRNTRHVLFRRCKQFPRVLPGLMYSTHLKFKTYLWLNYSFPDEPKPFVFKQKRLQGSYKHIRRCCVFFSFRKKKRLHVATVFDNSSSFCNFHLAAWSSASVIAYHGPFWSSLQLDILENCNKIVLVKHHECCSDVYAKLVARVWNTQFSSLQNSWFLFSYFWE